MYTTGQGKRKNVTFNVQRDEMSLQVNDPYSSSIGWDECKGLTRRDDTDLLKMINEVSKYIAGGLINCS